MKKVLIFTIVFAAFAMSSTFAQTITRPADTGTTTKETKVETKNPTNARPGSDAPATRPGSAEPGKTTRPEKGSTDKKGKGAKGKGKGKAKAKGQEKGEMHGEGHEDHEKGHEGHDHGKAGEGHDHKMDGGKGKTEKNGKTPVETPQGRTTQKQGAKN